MAAPPSRYSGSVRTILGALIAAVLFVACSTPVGVQRSGFEPVFAEQSQNVLTNGALSAWSREALASVGLWSIYQSDPEAALARVEAMGTNDKLRGAFAVLAELRYERALRTGAPGDFLAAAIDAYLFLFCDELQPAPDPYDPRFRLACDIHNRALARALLDDSGAVSLRDQVFETPLGSVEIVASRPGFPWGEEHFARFLPADAFQVRGLRERIRTSGIGVPLIAIRNAGSSSALAASGHMAPKMKLGATAVLELEGGLDAVRARRMRGSLQLYLATDSTTVSLSGHEVPLETDLTAPLAYTLESSEIWDFSITGFLGGSNRQFPPGIFLAQPYQRGKIPLVLVHGTASNPAVWAQMLNGLKRDPELRRRYQIWLAIYSTGTPILLNASDVREALVKVVQDLDPEGTDAALRNMIVVGHSQGGLIAQLLVTSSGDHFWSHISSEPFDRYPLSDSARELIRRSAFFEPLPYVKRVVFISTPHRGSFVADGWIGGIAQKLVSLPAKVTAASRDLLKGDRLPSELRDGIPDSVANMKPDSMFVRVLGTLPFAPDVHLHSIVSVDGTGPVEEGDDGVVKYSSAHLDEAESEFVVRHGHSCQNEPETILEVRRIMRRHLAEIVPPARPE